jgi:hypothetical protein
MKPFHLESAMTTLRGVFYPTGYMVLMFPTEQDAREAERRLVADGNNGEEILYMTPSSIVDELATTAGDEDAMPSIGTEAATVRHFVDLARQGHHGVMIKSESPKDTEHAMALLDGLPISFGQKYRRLVIEDLVTEH